MTWFLVGLAAGIVLAVVVLLLISYLNAGSLHGLLLGREYAGYRKVMVAAVDRPFDEKAVRLAACMLDREGVMVTLYIAEIPLNRPLESGAERELSAGMDQLEAADRLARKMSVRPLPRIERSRLGSKTIVEIQRQEDFDLVVLDVHPGSRFGRQGRKIAEYVQEHATCAVIVVSTRQGD